MAEIENKTSVVMKYYASCVPQPEPEVAAENVPVTEEASAKAVQSEPKPVPEPEPEQEPEQKADVSPAEIFAVLEALYAGAATTDANAVNTQISALSRINLPPKLNAVFPELALASRQNDFLKIKAVIDSLRTRA